MRFDSSAVPALTHRPHPGPQRRRADLVPPREPGPAYDTGPRTVTGAGLVLAWVRHAITTTLMAQPARRLHSSAPSNDTPPPASRSTPVQARPTGPRLRAPAMYTAR